MRAFAFLIGLLTVIAGGDAVRGHEGRNPGLKAVADSSTDIVVAEVLHTQPRPAIEGARDTVKLKVVRPLKGPLQPGDEVGVYYHLFWVDAGKLEKPKFEQGQRYTVFLVNSMGYTLTDQWLAVLPEHPELDGDVARSLNEVGNLWHEYRRQRPTGPIVSRLRIDILPEATVARTKDGLILSVKIVNHSSKEITTRLAHEWHGGEWPPTDLYASVTPVQAKQTSLFEPVFLKGEKQGLTKETRILPGKSVTVELRMDWPGTGSVQRTTLPMSPSQGYFYLVRLVMVFDAPGRGAQEYAASAVTRVNLAVE